MGRSLRKNLAATLRTDLTSKLVSMFWVEWREMRQDTTVLPRPGDRVVRDTNRAEAEPDSDCLVSTVSVYLVMQFLAMSLNTSAISITVSLARLPDTSTWQVVITRDKLASL